MKLPILAILAFMILVSYNACTSKTEQPKKQDISIMYIQDTSKLSVSEKNQNIIIENQKEMIKNQEALLVNQENVLTNQKNVLKNQDSIKEDLIDSTQHFKIEKGIKSIIVTTSNTAVYTESMYIQLAKTGEALKIQQKQIDSLIVVKLK